MWHKIEVIGNLGSEPEMKYTPSGQAVTSFSLAANRSYKKNDEWAKETTWFRCEVWGAAAEFAAKLAKGAKVLVVGRLKPDTGTGGPRIWTNKEGEAKASFEIHVSELKSLEKIMEKAAPDVGDGENMPF